MIIIALIKMTSVLCVDISGSTSNSDYYKWVHSFVEKNHFDKYVEWENRANIVSKKQVMSRTYGNGGTVPSSFISHLKDCTRLVVITDGQISEQDVLQCNKQIKKYNYTFNEVEFHFYDTGGAIDLSVSAAFTKNSKYQIFRHSKQSDESLAKGDTSSPIELDQYFDNPILFLNEAESVLSNITMKQLGENTANLALKDKLCELKNNLRTYILNQNSLGTEFASLRNELNIDTIKRIVDIDNDSWKTIEPILSKMIGACDKLVGFSFSLLNTDNGTLRRATELQEIDPNDVTITEETFESVCPISYDLEQPCLLIKKGEPVLMDLEKKEFDAILENPFLLLNNADIISKIKNRLGSVIGINSNKMLENKRDPFQGVSFSSSIVLSNDFYASNKFAIADLLFGNKLVGPYDSWIAVLYLCFDNIDYFKDDEYRTPYLQLFKTYMMNRMQTTMTAITLSPLIADPPIKAPYDIALYYCLVSPHIRNYGRSNRLRDMHTTAHHLMKLVDLFNYSYDKNSTNKLIKQYAAFDYLIKYAKENKNWYDIIRSQWQNSITIDGTIVFLDGPGNNANIPAELNIPLNDLIKLASVIDVSKTTLSIKIDNIADVPIPPPVYNYSKISNTYTNDPTIICNKTMRPYYHVKLNNQDVTWEVAAKAHFGNSENFISTYNYYIRFVQKYEKYPTKNEMILFMSRSERNSIRNRDTLPMKIIQDVDFVFAAYEKVDQLTVEEFIKITSLSRKIETRIQMEN